MPSESGKLSRVALVGASSLRGKELKQTIEDRSFPAADIVLLDESIMAVTLTEAAGEPTFIRALDEDRFEGVRFAFFAGTVLDAEQNWSAAHKAGATVIDMTGALASSAHAAPWIPSLAASIPAPSSPARNGAPAPPSFYSPPAPVIIACTMATALHAFQPQRVALILFPPVSERDQAGIEELEGQTTNLLSFRPIQQPVFDAQVAFNLLSKHGGRSRPGLAKTRSEIACDVAACLAGRVPVPAIQLVQAPVFYGYAFAACAEFASAQPPEQLEAALANLGVKISAPEDAPTNVSVAGESEIQLARIEPDPSIASAVWLWGVADNLRLAATNAVRIAEELVANSPG